MNAHRKAHLINEQRQQNAERLERYKKRLVWWVIEFGITHRAVELKYFGTDSYTKLKQETANGHTQTLT